MKEKTALHVNASVPIEANEKKHIVNHYMSDDFRSNLRSLLFSCRWFARSFFLLMIVG